VKVFQHRGGWCGMAMLCCAATVGAQTQSPRAQTLDFIGMESMRVPIVVNAPFSAEGITTVTQVLGDGTRIERTVTTSVARDGMGRVRREQTILGLASVSPSIDAQPVVTIVDPVANATYVLNPTNRTARRTPMRIEPVRAAAGRGDAPSPPAPPGAPPAPPPLPPPPPPGGDSRPLPGTFTPRTLPFGGAPLVGGRQESLGTRQIEGVSATGWRSRMTIPVGQVGNDRPLEITEERWESAELQMLIRSHRSDPRTGEVDYRLANIVRAEPPASLFEVPSDYTVTSATLPFPQRTPELPATPQRLPAVPRAK
jgi:hypothetical protein